MFPEINLGFLGSLRLYTVMAAAGAAVFCLLVYKEAGRIQKTSPFPEKAYIFPKLAWSLFGGYFGALFYDAAFKYAQRGALELKGIAFYGGLIGGVITLYLFFVYSPKATSLTASKWFDTLTIPFLAFHFVGRIGCFLSGCCYGKPTDSAFGVSFPDQPKYGVFHYGQKVYPTQLFEAAGIIAIIFLLAFVFKKNRYKLYLIFYSALRFFVEFFRGDDRGVCLFSLSPAQNTSLAILLAVVLYSVFRFIKQKSK